MLKDDQEEGQVKTTPAGGGGPAGVAYSDRQLGRRSIADPVEGALGGGVRCPEVVLTINRTVGNK